VGVGGGGEGGIFKRENIAGGIIGVGEATAVASEFTHRAAIATAGQVTRQSMRLSTIERGDDA
jgi:hypothetical protein